MDRWDLARARLAPIIGEDGFRVLFARSLHRTRRLHPWLAHDAGKRGHIFASLKTSIESQGMAEARLGCLALSANFSELLHALIGKELAARLLGPS